MAPVPVMPVMMVPMAMVPVVVMPVAMMPMVMPVHLDRLDPIDFVLRHHRRLDLYRRRHVRRLTRERRHGSGLRACGKHDRARDQSSTEIQEIPEFHEFMPFHELSEREGTQSRRINMNVR